MNNRPIQKDDVYAVAPTIQDGVEVFPATYALIVEAQPIGLDLFDVMECGFEREIGEWLPNGGIVRQNIDGKAIRFLIECGQWTLLTPKTIA